MVQGNVQKIKSYLVNKAKNKTLASVPGNIDLNDRPVIHNPDGTYSTFRSMSFDENGKEVLVPTIRKGLDRPMTNQEAIDHYRNTGEHLGKFNSAKDADAYAEQLHNNYQLETESPFINKTTPFNTKPFPSYKK